jgi:class 3 adenylate cyclase/serine/threonine protein kinase
MSSGTDRQLKVVLFSDVVGSSEQIFADELIAVQHIKTDLSLIKDAIQSHDGSLVKSLGDGVLATFDAPTQALEFVQDTVAQLAAQSGGPSLQHRFGIHVGEIYADGDDIIGQGVHLASRLQTIAPPNGVAFVQSTYEMVDGEFRRRARLMGPVSLAGLPAPVICYSIAEKELLGERAVARDGGDSIEDVLAGSPYRLARSLGRSPGSRTYLVKDPNRDRHAVLKLFPGDEEQLAAMELEAACLDRLRHPRIPRSLDGFIRAGQYCLLQEWIPGPSLEGSFDYLRKKQRLSELLRQVLEVLEVTHGAGIIHGDLHPANLIPAADSGQLFVVDFSLIKSRAGGSSFILPTPESFSSGETEQAQASEPTSRSFYSPPERVRFGRIWAGVDLYGLGVTALGLYTGRPPGELYDQDVGGWKCLDLDPEVVAWLSPLLEESPGRRIHSAADALHLLDRPQSTLIEPAGPAQQGVIEKARLVAVLARIYGPVVQLLLDSWPSVIPFTREAALRSKLEESGLRTEDVEAALAAAATRPSPPSPAPSATVPAVSMDGVPEPDREALLAVLRRSIGPVADLLLTPELTATLMRDERSAAAILARDHLPAAAIQELLEAARERRERPSPSPPAPSPGAVEAAEEQASLPAAPQPEGPPDDAVLRHALLEAVGPIGEQIFEEVRGLPASERLKACIGELQEYGVDAEVINRLVQECG